MGLSERSNVIDWKGVEPMVRMELGNSHVYDQGESQPHLWDQEDLPKSVPCTIGDDCPSSLLYIRS